MNNKIKLIVLAITPFIIGNLFNFLILKNMEIELMVLFSILFYLYWFYIGFLSSKFTESTLQSMLIGNSGGILSIVLLMFTGLVLKEYLTGIIGLQLQLYFLPSIKIADIILKGLTSSMGSNLIFFMSFVLMLATYFAGYHMGLKRM